MESSVPKPKRKRRPKLTPLKPTAGLSGPPAIHANDVVTVDIAQAITSGAPALMGAYGSMVLRFSAPGVGVLLSAVMVELPGTPIEFHLDGWQAPDAKTALAPGGREGIWWLPRDSAKDWLVITNSAQSPATANLVLYDASGKSWQQRLTLGARQMQRLSVRALVHQAGLTGSFGGIEIDLPKGLYSVDTAHFVYDEANGSMTLLKMFDHDPTATIIQRSLTDRQWTIRAPMLALSNPDPALAVPENTLLQPVLLLRNASAKSYPAQLTFNWRSDSTKGKGISVVFLRPHQTQLVDVAALQAKGTIPATAHWAYVSISAPINPDELLAVATSFDASGKFGAQTPFSDQVASHWEGGKWEVDANHNTLIAVGNAGTTASKTRVTFYYNAAQGKYEFEQTLGPDEQVWLDMSKLIGNQVPDKNGKTISPDVMSGTYNIRNLTNKEGIGLFEGKLVVDKTYGYAVHGCGNCCGWSYAHLHVNPMGLFANEGLYQEVWATNSCTHIDENAGPFSQSSWWTDNTNIATANNYYIWGVSSGSTTQYASGYLQSTVPRTCPQQFWPNLNAATNVSAMVINSISPQVGAQAQNVGITINGDGFGTNPRVTTNALGSSITGVSVNQQGTVITATYNIGSNTTPGSYAVVVTSGTQQKQTSFYITAPCSVTVSAPTPQPPVVCALNGGPVNHAPLQIAGTFVPNITDTVATAHSDNDIVFTTSGSPYKYTTLCPPGDICYYQDYIGYTNNTYKSANIDWTVQIYCSNSPYPSQISSPVQAISCQ